MSRPQLSLRLSIRQGGNKWQPTNLIHYTTYYHKTLTKFRVQFDALFTVLNIVHRIKYSYALCTVLNIVHRAMTA